MKSSDFISDWIKNLRLEAGSLTLQEDDVRLSFFALINDIAHCYYRNYLLVEISTLINQKKIRYDSIKDNKHLKIIEALIKNERSYASHFNSMNRQLLVDSWSTFELCLNTFSEAILDKQAINKLLNSRFRDIINKEIKDTLSDEIIEKFRMTLAYDNLTHVSITRKIDAIFKMTKGYRRDVKNDKAFLLFYLKFRNSMHGNYIYRGNDFRYEFGDAKFEFADGKQIIWNDPFHGTPELFFYLMGNLASIWKEIISANPFEGGIDYPDLDQS